MYTPTQLEVTGSLLPKTIRNAPCNRDVNRRKKNYRFALNSNDADRSLISKGMLINVVTVCFYFAGHGVEFPLWSLVVINKSITHLK